VEGDNDVAIDCSVAWTTTSKLRNLSPERVDTVIVGDEPPNRVTSLKRTPSEISDTLERL
jgi:hypothetical protein